MKGFPMGVIRKSFSSSIIKRGKMLEIVNPSNGSILFAEEDNEITVREKFQKVRKSHLQWRQVPLEAKKQMVEKFGKILVEKQDELATSLTNEMGKPITQSYNELKGVQPRLKFFLENIDQQMAIRICRTSETFVEEVHQEPLGLIANISAWNYPYFVGLNVLVPALLTGNCVLYKPSEYSAITGLHIVKMFHQSGIPEDVLVPVIGRGDVGESLLNQAIDGVFFTGSNATGTKISRQIAGRMIKAQFELGGKDPIYISKQVDIKAAAAATADGAFYNTGQSCCSVERIYVHQDIMDPFVNAFVNEVKSFSIGDPLDRRTYIGPLAMKKQLTILENQVKDALAKGAKLLLGGKRMDPQKWRGNYFEPTILIDVNHSMDLMKEESFGPIIGIQKVKNEEEAVRLMNDTHYGLTAGVYSESKEEAMRILSLVNSGTAYWNACDRVSPWLPWSGRRGSGIGKTLGLEGIRSFLRPKAYHLINPK